MKHILSIMFICLSLSQLPIYSESIILISSPGEAFTKSYPCEVLVYRHDRKELASIFSVDDARGIDIIQVTSDNSFIAIWRYVEVIQTLDVRESKGELCVIDILNLRDTKIVPLSFLTLSGGHMLWSEEVGWMILTNGNWRYNVKNVLTYTNNTHTKHVSTSDVPWHQITDRGRYMTKSLGETRMIYGNPVRFRVNRATGYLAYFIGKGHDLSPTSIPCDQIPEEYLVSRNSDEGILLWADKESICIEFDLLDEKRLTQKEALVYSKQGQSWSTHTRPGNDENDHMISLIDGHLVYQQLKQNIHEDSRGIRYFSTGRYELRTKQDEILCEWDIDPFSAPLVVTEEHLYYRSGISLYRIERKDDAKPELILEDKRLDRVYWGALVTH